LNFGNKWDFAPAPEDSKNYVIAPQHELFINGKFVAPTSGKYFESINPATEQTLTTIAAANAEDVDSAVKSARKAYDKVWSKMPGRERGKYLYRIARIIQEKARELAVLETMDGGKTIKESRDVDLPLVAAHFFYYAGWADKLKYAFPGKTPQPLGVAGQIIPWNFPLLMAAWKIAPALACGNTVVLKPAETTSLTALRLAQIFQEAELPEGVVNIVTGAGETGAALVNHPDLDKIAFTGSATVDYTVSDFGGNASSLATDPTSSSNHVMMSTKTNGAETWAGTTLGTASGFKTIIPQTATAAKMTVRIYSPAAGLDIKLKLEEHGNGANSVETDVLTTKAGQWETLTFDFSHNASGTPAWNQAYKYDKCSAFFDFGNAGTGSVFYWDDITLL